MAKVILSTSHNEYELVTNGWNKSDTALDMVVLKTDAETLEYMDEAFSGNDTITLVDGTIRVNAYGYVLVDSIALHHDYDIGDGQTADVWKITCKTPSIYAQIAQMAAKLADDEATIAEHTESIAVSSDAIAEIAEMTATNEENISINSDAIAEIAEIVASTESEAE